MKHHPHPPRTDRLSGGLLLVLACALVAPAFAQPRVAPMQEQRLRTTIQNNTRGQVSVDAIYFTPVPGIYAVQSQGEVFYTDETGRYTFVNAALIDTQNRQDLTAAMNTRVNRIDFTSLPTELAIREVHGNGKRKLAVFEDPNCPPICQGFNKLLARIPDVTIYRFMYPVISPDSMTLARAAWCSRDRAQTWRMVMDGGRPNGTTECNVSGLRDILAFGAQNRIIETPTVVLTDGSRMAGAMRPDLFMKALDASGR